MIVWAPMMVKGIDIDPFSLLEKSMGVLDASHVSLIYSEKFVKT